MAAKKPAKKKSHLTVGLDAERLGLLAGAVVATLLMPWLFFYMKIDVTEALIRAGVVFVVTYASVYCVVRVVLRATLIEVVGHKKTHSSAAKETSEESALPSSEERPGGNV